MKFALFVNIRGIPKYGSLYGIIQFNYGFADKRSVVALVMIESIRSGRRVPFAENKGNLRTQFFIDDTTGFCAEIRQNIGFKQFNFTVGTVEKRQIARISVAGNKIAAYSLFVIKF